MSRPDDWSREVRKLDDLQADMGVTLRDAHDAIPVVAEFQGPFEYVIACATAFIGMPGWERIGIDAGPYHPGIFDPTRGAFGGGAFAQSRLTWTGPVTATIQTACEYLKSFKGRTDSFRIRLWQYRPSIEWEYCREMNARNCREAKTQPDTASD